MGKPISGSQMRVWEGEVVVGLGLYGTNRLELYQSLEFPRLYMCNPLQSGGWRQICAHCCWGIPPLQRQGHGDLYIRSTSLELERVISESSLLGAVIVLGDFNAHLGRLGGARGCGETNAQGVLVGDLMARCHLNAISLGSVATGPCHAYESGSKRTIVDYIFADE